MSPLKTWLLLSFRAVGLELVNTLLRPWNALEHPKPVLQKSRWTALSRCTIHILPTIVAGFLLWLNATSYYLGPGLSFADANDSLYLALYQVASKVQEREQFSPDPIRPLLIFCSALFGKFDRDSLARTTT